MGLSWFSSDDRNLHQIRLLLDCKIRIAYLEDRRMTSHLRLDRRFLNKWSLRKMTVASPRERRKRLPRNGGNEPRDLGLRVVRGESSR